MEKWSRWCSFNIFLFIVLLYLANNTKWLATQVHIVLTSTGTALLIVFKPLFLV